MVNEGLVLGFGRVIPAVMNHASRAKFQKPRPQRIKIPWLRALLQSGSDDSTYRFTSECFGDVAFFHAVDDLNLFDVVTSGHVFKHHPFHNQVILTGAQ